jgi:cephalosporin-C deacetylase-like acetyl esterase
MMRMMRTALLCLLFPITTIFPNLLFAQQDTSVVLQVTADHSDWVYTTGQQVSFTVSLTRAGKMLPGQKIHYEIGPEKMTPKFTGDIVSMDGRTVLDGGSMPVPGFLRCTVTAEINRKKYRALATAAFSPTSILPAVTTPPDFDHFWDSSINAGKKVPLDPRMKLIEERSNGPLNIYEVSFRNGSVGARVYGILCVPKKEGKYPVALKVPGAGVRPYRGDSALAVNGIITLEIGIHGISVTLPVEVYNDLSAGALLNYPQANLDDRNRYYYNRVYLGCIRSIDFLCSLPQADTSRVAVYGGSQGGALTIVTAALDRRIKYASALYPALSDMNGYALNRAGGWPHTFSPGAPASLNTEQKVLVASYYDVVNFAKRVRVPGFYSWGFNDETCPPTSTYAAYNQITAPKELFITKESGHAMTPEQRDRVSEWLVEHLVRKN